MNTCIFCPNPLNGSDEHIIPQSINGQLHSKELICAKCNNTFGRQLDPILKESLVFILHALNIGNVKKMLVEDESGNIYLYDSKTGKVKHTKPEISIFKVDENKTGISVSGDDDISTVKALATKAARVYGKAALKGKYSITRTTKLNKFLRAKAEIIISGKLILALNKIIVEYFCYCGLDRTLIAALISRVAALDERLDNIRICNSLQNIRKPGETEISHLLVIRSDPKKKMVYAYIEIFNVVCGFTVLVENYQGDEIDFVYHQDAINRQILSGDIILDLNKIEDKPNGFEKNVNALFSRNENRRIQGNFATICEEIIAELNHKLEKGEITGEERDREFIERSCKIAAELMVFEYPDAVDDFSEEEIKGVNYIHSLIREEKIDDFKHYYQNFIGHEFKLDGEEDIYKMEEFDFVKHRPRNGINMVKVFCCFTSIQDGSKKYIPATEVFKSVGTSVLVEESTWL